MTAGQLPRWPLVLIAAPAAVAVWSGWVGLGTMAGFGVVHPLPGILSGFRLNTAITLPVGVETYGAYALGAWLAPGTPQTARMFARRSALGALALGMAGQVIFHLLAAAGAARAPWPVVVLVSCMPVVTLGFGAALTHLLRAPVADVVTLPAAVGEPAPVAVAVAPASTGHAATGSRKESRGRPARNAVAGRPRKRSAADLEADALSALADDPQISGAELGRQLGVSPRTGQRIRDRLATPATTTTSPEGIPA